ncbi:DMT family transporter [Neisseria perflava]|uniref:DMT family transporter n=1 Tax=Neisseria perflava TaxID=33053 RepID=UPI00209CE625|nr:DMT family transporter [Neisseria perflava]MCP1659850.1 drug/metabolite transporter (DMT)-like permease [Neisseria perflava]MCP1772654.1 drug/metabolite transporter (DMT)-like permease [Neisseria perflava]
MTWIYFTLLAAFSQAWRNAFQKQLSTSVPVLGVTLARFIAAWPLALLYLSSFYWKSGFALPDFPTAFWLYTVGAAGFQILATALMVRLFQWKNYAVGAGLAKSEAVIAAVLGVLFFGTQISLTAWLGVLIGGVAVFLLSGATRVRAMPLPTLLTGIASGTSFALTSLFVREAGLCLDLPRLQAAAWVLFLVIFIQAVALTAYLHLRQRDTLRKLFAQPKLMCATSTASVLGSLGWFSAMSLNDVAFVKTLGQVEVIFMLLISRLWFREHLKLNDLTGLILIMLAAILVVKN